MTVFQIILSPDVAPRMAVVYLMYIAHLARVYTL